MAFLLQETHPSQFSMEEKKVEKLGETKACSGEGAQVARRAPGILKGVLEPSMKLFSYWGGAEVSILGAPQLI